MHGDHMNSTLHLCMSLVYLGISSLGIFSLEGIKTLFDSPVLMEVMPEATVLNIILHS